MAEFVKRYKHGLIILVYSIVYLILFRYLETEPVYGGYHVINTVFDSYIPFCEFFIVPYLLWFPYMIVTVLYFVFKNNNKKEYYQLVLNLMMGMTIFLIVSDVYPNILYLRPSEFPRENVFTDLVRFIYRADTPTNVLPSIHVFNSLAIHMSLTNCEALRDNRVLRRSSLVLTILIILSTMFLKQHSVIDVCLGCTLALFGYLFFYPQKAQEHSRSRVAYGSAGKRHQRRL
ncbi:MAG: phosphatase PAP2 family protein [Eubacteriales bacterium]|nr:phosphatase PAP2 family protein [Eubacteriales bacterium]